MAQETEMTFEQRAQAHYDREMADIARVGAAFSEADTDEEYAAAEALQEELCGEPLSVTKKTVYDVLLGWGGPSCGYSITVSEDGEVESGDYWFQDWFQEKRRFPLTADELNTVARAYNLYFGE